MPHVNVRGIKPDSIGNQKLPKTPGKAGSMPDAVGNQKWSGASPTAGAKRKKP